VKQEAIVTPLTTPLFHKKENFINSEIRTLFMINHPLRMNKLKKINR